MNKPLLGFFVVILIPLMVSAFESEPLRCADDHCRAYLSDPQFLDAYKFAICVHRNCTGKDSDKNPTNFAACLNLHADLGVKGDPANLLCEVKDASLKNLNLGRYVRKHLQATYKRLSPWDPEREKIRVMLRGLENSSSDSGRGFNHTD